MRFSGGASQPLEKNVILNVVACRWMFTVNSVYRQTGKLVEKYDVARLGVKGGSGEYPTQDGFGWSNGVMRKLMALYPREAGFTRADQCSVVSAVGDAD